MNNRSLWMIIYKITRKLIPKIYKQIKKISKKKKMNKNKTNL